MSEQFMLIFAILCYTEGRIHTDIVIKAHESTAEFFVALHDDPDPRAHTFVDELCQLLVFPLVLRHTTGFTEWQ